jgi:hypothetical protein
MQALARRTITLATTDLVDADGIKTSIATAATAQSYTTAALNGALVFSNTGEPRFAGFLELASYPTVTASANGGSYVVGSAIEFVGTYAGQPVTRTALLTTANGGETVFANGPIDTVTTIRVAAQVNTGGAFTFGFSGVCPRKKADGHLRKWGLVGGGSGNLVVGYPLGGDTLVTTAGQQHPVAVSRIYATTAVPVTIYEYD